MFSTMVVGQAMHNYVHYVQQQAEKNTTKELRVPVRTGILTSGMELAAINA